MTKKILESPKASQYPKEFLMGLYRTLLTERVFDENLVRLLHEGQVSGFYHSGQGQEAIAAGVCAALREDDYIFYDHRGCNQKIAKGVPLERLYGDFLGRVIGTTGGLGAGIVHSAWPELGVLGQSGTLGASFNIAVGTAMSAKIQKQDRVTVCFFGDGSAARETFHGGMNWAGLWQLPVVFVLENNEYGISLHYTKEHALKEFIADRAEGYGIPSYVLDGNDVLMVYELSRELVERARAGAGPAFVEAMTWRMRGHFEGDPVTYIPEEVRQERNRQEPIGRFERKLLEEGMADQAALSAVRGEVEQAVHRAIDIATASPLPPRERILQGLLAD